MTKAQNILDNFFTKDEEDEDVTVYYIRDGFLCFHVGVGGLNVSQVIVDKEQGRVFYITNEQQEYEETEEEAMEWLEQCVMYKIEEVPIP